MLEGLFAGNGPHPYVVCITEHWLVSGEELYCNMTDYRVAVSRSRTLVHRGKSYGGVLIYLNNSLNFKVLDHLNSFSVDSVCEIVGLKLIDYDILVFCVYRAPEYNNFRRFCEIVECILNTYGLNSNLCLCGDFNLNFNDPKSNEVRLFTNMTNTFGLFRTIFEPTRGVNCIDNIFLNFSENNFKVEVHDTGFSDHKSQLLTFPIKSNSNLPKIIKSRPLTEAGKMSFRNIVQRLDWSFVDDSNLNTNKKVEIFQQNISDSAMIAFPEKNKIISQNKKKAFRFTKELKRLRSELHLVSKLYSGSPSPDLARMKIEARKKYRHQLDLTKKNINDNRLAVATNWNKTAWEIINTTYKNRDNVAQNSKITPDEFNINFSDAPLSIINNVPSSSIDPGTMVSRVAVAHVDEEFFFIEITEGTIQDIIRSLTRKNSKDFYGLNLDILSIVSDLIAPVLVKLINLCFRVGVFPDCFKVGLIHPVFKKGEKNLASNFRPISILPILSKIVEKIMADQIVKYLNFYKLFTPCQFGFRKNLSTTDALNFFGGLILGNFNDKSQLHATMCDLSRAFECLDHTILLAKLRHYRFSEASIQLLKTYLEDRSQMVKVGEILSSPRLVNTGIPTGSILGPLIFLLYINDLPVNLPEYAKTTIFADDTTLFVNDKNQDEVIRKGELILAQAQVWFNSNRLHLNQAKTQKVIFTLNNVHNFENPAHVDLLGFRLDPHLRWHLHIDKVANKLSSRIFLLRRLQKQVSQPTLKNAYYGLIHSLLSYGVLLWGHSPSAHDLFILQKKAVRILSGAKYQDHAQPLFINLGVLTLPSLYILQCILHVKKNVSNYKTFEDVHSYNTRNKTNLVPVNHRVKAARNSINYYGINFFNKIPPETRNLPYANFKNKMERFLKNKGLYSVQEFFNIDHSEFNAICST